MRLKSVIDTIVHKAISPFIQKYLSAERLHRYKGIKILVRPGVFHPGLFFSTRVMLGYLEGIKLKDKSFLEIGGGSGLISISSAIAGAKVTCVDISKLAVENIKINAEKNDVKMTILDSDLFSAVPKKIFDIIVVNPPYYPEDSTEDSQYAWYCGKDYQYFTSFFTQIKDYINSNTLILMVLSEVCNLKIITSIAHDLGFSMEIVHKKHVLWERNFIYQIKGIK